MVLLVVMGVSGSGNWDGNSTMQMIIILERIERKCQKGYHSLMRIPWLCALHDILRREDASRQDAILACSALKKMYRHVLISGASATESNQPQQPGENPALKILFVHLDGPKDIIAGRLEKRRGHFMPPELLKSQFDTLEPPSAPENFITVSLEKSLPEIVLEIERAILRGEALLE
ncbi:putative gluconokinase isoform 2-T2 [Cyanocitta cristata]